MIKYIGSKRLLVPAIAAVARSLPGAATAVDPFCGTTRVSQALKQCGLTVHANDTASYSEVLAECYVRADARSIPVAEAQELLAHLSSLPPRAGYFTETFCVRSRYFHPKNGARIDAIREEIEALRLAGDLRAIALTSLLEAADRVDSTTGLQMAYLKRWAPRALADLELRMPRLLPGTGTVSRRDANALVRDLPEQDLAYLDPPYNQHSFFGNYHVWETLVRNDRPAVYGVACKRVDCRENKSAYNSRRGFAPALDDLLDGLRARTVLFSCNDEGYLDAGEVARRLARWGTVGCLEVDYRRYVGARIGIYNPKGERVGEVSHLRNREMLLLAAPDSVTVGRALEAAAAALPASPSAVARAGRTIRA
ncbi:MAG: DNA adenine methylase [Candidatus Eisenbacteria bacterium]